MAAQTCPMAGRMGAMLASGYVDVAIEGLRQCRVPPHVHNAVRNLNSACAGAGDCLMDNFKFALSRLAFRMSQSFATGTACGGHC